MKSWFVYKHTSPSGKVYIGITCKPRPNDRWEGGSGYTGCTYFMHAINKYGWDNIKHDIILDGIDKAQAVYAERYLIRWYKNIGMCYNLTDGGDGVIGMKMPEDAKKKISAANKGLNVGRKRSPETRRKLSKYFSKAIEQLDAVTYDVIAEYESAKQAAILIGHSGKETNIAHVLHGRNNTAFGYAWRFKK